MARSKTGQVQSENQPLRFGLYRLTADGELRRSSQRIAQLPRRLAAVLTELVAANGGTVSRLDLLMKCWGNQTVNDENLSRAIADLRKILRSGERDPIEAVYGLGYRLNVQDIGMEGDLAARRAASFCREAWHRLYQRRLVTLDSAEHLFDLAATESPEHLQALLGIAVTQIHRMQLGYSPAIEAWARARIALDRALAIDPRCADALAIRGLGLAWAEWNFGDARLSLERAAKIDPDSFVCNMASGWYHLSTGRFDLARRLFGIAANINPAAMETRGILAVALMYAANAKESLSVAKEMSQLDPGGPISQAYFGWIEATLGSAERAIESAEHAFAQLPESPVVGSILAYALAKAGQHAQARILLETPSNDGMTLGTGTMACPAWLEIGDRKAALASLEAGAAMRCPWLPVILHDPRVESLRRESFCSSIYEELFGLAA